MNVIPPAPAPLTGAWSERNTEPELARATAELYLKTPHKPQAQVLLAYLDWRRGLLPEAAAQAFGSVERLRPQGPSIWLGHAINILGCIESQLSRPNEAMQFFDQQVQVAQALQDELLEAVAQHDMGMCQILQNPESARFHLQKVLPVFEKYHDDFGITLVHYNLGVLDVQAQHFTEARAHFEQAIAFLMQCPIDSLEARVRSIYLELLERLDDQEAIPAQLRRLGEMARIFPDNLSIQLDVALALAQHERGQPQQVIERLTPMLPYLEPLGSHEVLGELHERLGQAYRALGNAEQAVTHLQAALDFEREFHSLEHLQQSRTLDVLHRVRTFEKMADEERRRSDQLQAHVQELQRLNVRIQQLSRKDSLTELANRYHLFEAGEDLAQQAGPDHPLAAALIDVDHFKSINDRYGHLVGDRVLIKLASLIWEGVRPDDLAARYGGDEFVILRPGDALSLTQTCQELQRRVQAFDWNQLEAGLNITISIGVAQTENADLDALLHLADQRMYRVKNTGRNALQDQS